MPHIGARLHIAWLYQTATVGPRRPEAVQLGGQDQAVISILPEGGVDRDPSPYRRITSTEPRHVADIGADGIHSAVRRADAFRTSRRSIGGRRVMWRGTSGAKPVRTRVVLCWACDHRQRMVIYPIFSHPDADGFCTIKWIRRGNAG